MLSDRNMKNPLLLTLWALEFNVAMLSVKCLTCQFVKSIKVRGKLEKLKTLYRIEIGCGVSRPELDHEDG